MNTEPNIKQAVPFFMIADMISSLAFYIDQVGFELKMKWVPAGRIEWCWLQFGHASIMLQEHMKTGEYTEHKKGLGVCVCFMCNDAVALYHTFRSKGLAVNEPVVENGLWVIKLTDPDGYNLLFESETDVSEETKYSDWIAAGK
ncbi:VOC family protein [Chitinophaga niabensis]|uniref:Glyoxalase/fosfomycin resistance/dioxygenase domain-containing protein n=1 Tax=Chitinophaga niabensis TaxID=536979 RepID=A0A1N6F1A2_9BACT|nr:VOC family protein [Chitinophaga niabensis]SIN89006.1 hypothetical protein SAMN04488055_1952 [Chitinophaga niabensis]